MKKKEEKEVRIITKQFYLFYLTSGLETREGWKEKGKQLRKINNNVYINVEINNHTILKIVSFLTMHLYTFGI